MEFFQSQGFYFWWEGMEEENMPIHCHKFVATTWHESRALTYRHHASFWPSLTLHHSTWRSLVAFVLIDQLFSLVALVKHRNRIYNSDIHWGWNIFSFFSFFCVCVLPVFALVIIQLKSRNSPKFSWSQRNGVGNRIREYRLQDDRWSIDDY